MPYKNYYFCILCNANIAILGCSSKCLSDELFSEITSIFGHIKRHSFHKLCQKCGRKLARIKDGRNLEETLKSGLVIKVDSHTPRKQHSRLPQSDSRYDITPRKNGKRQTKDTGTPEKPRKTRKNLLAGGGSRSNCEIPSGMLEDPITAVENLWQSNSMKEALIRKITNEIHTELDAYCNRDNPSILRKHTADDLINLSHEKIAEEIETQCPLWHKV